ncbi:hypothetical protein RR46_08270 [Papilio xuthus]|uniref:Uncharacterized protein n=1 Tax=Papilio xuthus TaxID=66420 RepID=A0A194PGK8_PAPXU|nr:hypothetical protein RR46_08270 [Papilio xuthus]
MDSESEQSSNTQLKNEKTKKMETESTDLTLDQVCKQVSKLDVDDAGNGSESSTDSEDLVNAINYNTITSLAALKDIIQGENDTPETDSFFQHYFMNHCNNLSSRNTNSPFPFVERRRLSQCREEDEDDEKKKDTSDVLGKAWLAHRSTDHIVNDIHSSKKQSQDEDSSTDERESSKRTVMGAKHKFLVTTAEAAPPPPASQFEKAIRSQVHNAHTVHFGTKGAEEQRRSVRSIFAGENLHRDKNYFDSSLIEIRSTVDGIPTSSEDIWVMRKEELKKEVVKPKSKVVDPLKQSVEDKLDKKEAKRSRSGTWGSQASYKEIEVVKKTNLKKEKERRSSDERRQKRDQRLDAAITRSSQSVGERKRRGSADDGQADQLYQQTIHGTSGVSRRPALFDIFKSRPRGDAKRHMSIMQQFKSTVQNMTKSGGGPKDGQKTEAGDQGTVSGSSSPHAHGADSMSGGVQKNEKTVSDTSELASGPNSTVTPSTQQGSDAMYAHTLRPELLYRRQSPIARVLDMFRGMTSANPQPEQVNQKRRMYIDAEKERSHDCTTPRTGLHFRNEIPTSSEIVHSP